jgi:hypothetical protein
VDFGATSMAWASTSDRHQARAPLKDGARLEIKPPRRFLLTRLSHAKRAFRSIPWADAVSLGAAGCRAGFAAPTGLGAVQGSENALARRQEAPKSS